MQIVICDDDEMFALHCQARLEALGKKYGAALEILIAGSGQQFLFDLNARYSASDLVYMDYHMPGVNGMDAARAMRSQGMTADIVFYTRDDAYALESYDVDALHYLVKGQGDAAKFDAAFLKALRSYNRKHRETITLSCAGERRNLDVQDVMYFEVRDRIVTVYYMDHGKRETFDFYSTLSRLEELLAASRFLRIHKAYLVSERFIEKKTSETVTLRDKTVLPIGRTYQRRV